MPEIIQTLRLSKTLDDETTLNNHVLLPPTCLSIKRGSFVALTGSSGSGKSTLINLLACLDQATSGRYIFDNQDITRLTVNEAADFRAQTIGIVFQQYLLIPQLTVIDNVCLPLIYAGNLTPQSTTYAKNLLKTLDIVDHAHKYPHQLSGGQQQRACLARALVNQPKLLLADEPTGALDAERSEEIIRCLQQINQQHQTTILMVTHDLSMTIHCDEVIGMQSITDQETTS